MKDKKNFQEQMVQSGDGRVKSEEDVTIEDILYGVTKGRMIVDNSENPDELISVASYMLHDIASMIAAYSEKFDEKPMTTGRIVDKIVDVARAYSLMDAGMVPDEALAIVGVDPVLAQVHYIDVETGKKITKEEFDANRDLKRK